MESSKQKDGVLQYFLLDVHKKGLIDEEGFIERDTLSSQFQEFVVKSNLKKFNQQSMLMHSLKYNGFIISDTDKGFKLNVEKFLKPANDNSVQEENLADKTSGNNARRRARRGTRKSRDGVLQSFLREIYDKKLIDSGGSVSKESLKNEFQSFAAKNCLVKFNNQDVLVESLKRNGFITSETDDEFKVNTEKFVQSSDNIDEEENSREKTPTADVVENKKIDKEILQWFLREIYLEDLIDSEGFIKKDLIKSEFQKFTAKYYFPELDHPNILIGSLLRNGFIISETRSVFQINVDKFLESSDDSEDELFPPTAPQEVAKGSLISSTENGEIVDPKSPEFQLTFQKGNFQFIKDDFHITSTSCCVCQESFSLQSDFDSHLQWHGKKLDYPLIGERENFDQVFSVSYKLCLDSYFLHLILRSKKEVTIEKIVIIRPDLQKSLNYVNKENVPFWIEKDGMKEFNVNCFLFHIGEKQPFVIIYKLMNDLPNIRRIEQHLFFREEDFPKCSMKLTSTRVPQRGGLVLKKKLKQKFPSAQIRSLSKANYQEQDIMNENTIVGQYLLEGKLKPYNFGEVSSFFLQMEDHAVLANYLRLSQKNKSIQRYGDEYSVTIKKEEIKGKVRIGEIASSYDDIIISFPKNQEDECDSSDEYYDDKLFDDLEYGGKFDRGQFNRRRKDKKKKEKKIFFGMVHKIAGDTAFFVLRQNKKLPEKPGYDIKFLPQRQTIKYQHYALEKVIENRNIRSLLFPTINFNKSLSSISLDIYNKTIESNPEQLQAVKNIVEGPNASAPYIIFGPPGTGKTTTIVESIFQLWKVKPSSRILVTTGSNAACDEVAKRLCRIFDKVDNEGMNLLRIYAAAAEKRMDNTEEFLFEASNFAHGYHFYPSLDSICLYRIVVVTLTVAGKLVQADISPNHFTHIFIDECASSTEPEAMIGIVGLLSSKSRLILSGDPKQLGPVLKCKRAEELGLDTSMMERLLKEKCYEVDPETGDYDRSIQTRLIRNFRTHPDILCLFNELYYNKELIPCAKKELTHFAVDWNKLPAKKFPIIFHAVNGVTKRDVGQTSSKNIAEIDLVMHYVRTLMKQGLNGREIKQEDIGIISPYRRQCNLIREKIDDLGWLQIEVGSVEIFQGKEKPIIIISTVRSSNIPGVGFLDNPKRLNVSLSRAQALMIIIGNPNTLQKVSDWRKVIEYCHKRKAMTGMRFRFNENAQNVEVNQLPNVPKSFQNTITYQNLQLQSKQYNTAADHSKKTTKVSPLKNNNPADVDVNLVALRNFDDVLFESHTSTTEQKSTNDLNERQRLLQYVMNASLQEIAVKPTPSKYSAANTSKDYSSLAENGKRIGEVSGIPSSTGTIKKNWNDLPASKLGDSKNISNTQQNTKHSVLPSYMQKQSSTTYPTVKQEDNLYYSQARNPVQSASIYPSLSTLKMQEHTKPRTQIVRPVQQDPLQYPGYSSSATKTTSIAPSRASYYSYIPEERPVSVMAPTPKQKKSTCTIS